MKNAVTEQQPLVSVIVATYRRERELRAALNSLVNQTYNAIEVIVVDDNGDEDWNSKVKAVIAELENPHAAPAIQHIVNSPNRGSAKARNIGIDAAKGVYVTFLDDDDVYMPCKIARQVRFMETNGLDYSITDLDLYNENGKLTDRRTRSYIKETNQQALLEYHLKYHLTGTDTMMFRREYLMKIGKFAPIDVGDEFYLMQRAIDGGGKFGYLPGSDIKAYVHTGDGGLSSGEGKIKGENALFAYKKTYFKKLKRCDIRHIRMRHYAVLAFAYLRSKKYLKCLINGCVAVLISPLGCFKMVKDSQRKAG